MDKTRGIKSNKIRSKKNKNQKNHILAIAIDEYSNGWTPLSYPVQECESLIELLIDRYDFDPHAVSRLYNDKATKELLRDELYRLPDELGRDDNLLLLFSGHGYYDEKIDEGYLVFSDAPKLKNDHEAEDVLFPFQRMVKYLNKTPACHIVFIIDSCFSGRFGQLTMKVPPADKQKENIPEEIPSRWVLTSGRKELVADNSPFAAAMREILADNRKERMLLQALYAAIRQKMSAEAAQTAYCAEIVAAEARGGEFVFRLREGLAKMETPADLLLLRQRLRQGARDYFDYLQNGRFAKLQFEEILLPEARLQRLNVEVKTKETSTSLRRALSQLWRKSKPHALLYGEGGMGKTVSCVRLWEELLEARSEETPVPIFLPLNEYNAATEAERKNRNYLYQFIAREYLDDARLTPELEDALKRLFKKQEGQATAILLLDGFNEVALDRETLTAELAEFLRRSTGVQTLIASRYDLRNQAWAQDFERLDLIDLSLAQIKAYLNRREIALPTKKELRKLLRNPMMLTLFVGSSQLANQSVGDRRISFKTRPSAKGELLHNFIEGQLAKFLLENRTRSDKEATFLWQAFLLRHLAPYLAWRMLEEGRFLIHTRKVLNPAFNIKSVVEEAYAYFSSFDFSDLYPDYEGRRAHLGFGIDPTDYDALEARNRRIRQTLGERLSLLVGEADALGFLHQNFRDYFAAVRLQRDLELAILQNRGRSPEQRSFPTSISKAPLDVYVRQLLGELEGEHTNKMEWRETSGQWQWSKGRFFLKNNLSELLEQCRGVFDRERLGFTVWNLLSIWKEQRGELSGADLSSLDFRRFSLNGLRMSRPGLAARLSGGILPRESLFPTGHSSWVMSVAISPDGQKILSGSQDRTIKMWEAQTGRLLLTLEGHTMIVMSVAFSPNGRRLASGSQDHSIRIWDAQTGKCISTLSGHTGHVNSLRFSPDSRRLVSGSRDRTICVWDAQTGSCLASLAGHSLGVNEAHFSPDGRRIVSASSDKTIGVWNARTGERLLSLEGHTHWVKSAVFSPDGKRILSGALDKTLRLWDAQSGRLLSTLEGHSSWVNSVAYDPSGSRMVSGSSDRTIKIWDTRSGRCLSTLEGHSDWVWAVAFSPDATRIVSGSQDKTIKVWDAQTGACLLSLSGHSSPVNSLGFSPDGSRMISGSSNKMLKVWDARTGKELLSFTGGSKRINSAAFSPDGNQIISGSQDKTVRIWDAQTGKALGKLEGHSSEVNSAAFSPDGRFIVSASEGDALKIWDAQTGRCLQTASNIPGLFIQECNLRELHPDSGLGEEDMRLLERYGGRL